MKAVVCQNTKLNVMDLPEPVPGKGQALLKVLRCGICGSDLHARLHCDHMADLMVRSGFHGFMRSHEPVVMGHEFSGEVLDYGRGCRRTLPAGTPVVALPLLRQGGRVNGIGLSQEAPGAYAERVVVEESMLLPVPNGLAPELAVLTEPMAVGWHAVRRAGITRRDVAIVIGCGPVGLAVICLLKARGVRHIVASDFSPGRRALARRCGATLVIDPAQDSPFSSWKEFGFLADVTQALELAVSTREKLGALPLPWWHVWRMAERLGLDPKRPVIFECVGAPGILQQLIDGAPMFSRIVVAGVCMQSDRIEPVIAINKEIDLRFVLAYTPPEFREVLHMLAEGEVDASALVTGEVGLEGVAAAFEALGDPERHAKILIDPASTAVTPVPPAGRAGRSA